MKNATQKAMSLILAFVIILGAVPLISFSAIAEGEDYYYSLINNGTAAEIIKYTGSDRTVIIPSQLGGVPVKEIGEKAFYGCLTLSNITIPDSVIIIGNGAFNSCTSLASLTIPGGVTSIESSAFFGCTSLTSVTIPQKVNSIGNSAFAGCSLLTAITVDESNQYYSSDSNGVLFNKKKTTLFQYPAGNSAESYTIPISVSLIKRFSFYGCTLLSNIIIQNKVKILEEASFYNCASLKSITIPNSITDIGQNAFEECKSLASITIPSSVTNIGLGCFVLCGSLSAIIVDGNNQQYSSDSNGVLFNKDKTALIQYPAGNNAKSYSIPNSVTGVEEGAFRNCAFLTAITIPDCASLASDPFSGCSLLSSIKVGGYNPYYSSDSNGVMFNRDKTALIQYPLGKSAGYYAIPGSVTSIEEGSFDGCTSLTNITIPSSVASIRSGAFERCTSLTGITIPSSVTSIGYDVFKGCASLKSVTIPSSVTSIGDMAFEGCSSELILYGKSGSCAQKFAADAGIQFSIMTSYEVTFNSNGGSAVASKTTNYNAKINAPSNPAKAGCAFDCWYTAASGGTKVTFPYKVKGDVTLYAHWISFASLTPSGISAASAGYTGVTVKWNAVIGATGYKVYRSRALTGTYSLVTTTDSASYINSGLTTGKTYYYKVLAYQTAGTATKNSKYSAVVSAKPVPSKPTGLKVIKATATAAKTTWVKVTGASGYEVNYATSASGKYSIACTTSISFTKAGLANGKTYFFKIRAYRTVDKTKVYGGYSTIVSVMM